MSRNGYDYMREYKKRGELWIHDGNPKRPHPILTSEKHGNAIFKLKIFDDNFFSEAMDDLILILAKKISLIEIDRVVGPETGATLMAQSLASKIECEPDRRRPCHWSSPRKLGEGKSKKLIFRESKQFTGENVLICDNALTTGESVELTASGIEAKGGFVLPFEVVSILLLAAMVGCIAIAVKTKPKTA